ncbi:MAG: S8 family serine peptidase [Pseudonocardiaceae bacterium]
MIDLPSESGAGQVDDDVTGSMPDGLSEPTGRYLVVLAEALRRDEQAMGAALRSLAGVSDIVSASDFSEGGGSYGLAQIGDTGAVLFPQLAVAVVAGEPDRLASLTAAVDLDERIYAVEPEQMLYALSQPEALRGEYVPGYRDAVAELCEEAVSAAAPQFVDTPEFTWGLQATRVTTSPWTGAGVSVALLDTGMDLRHPDFADRNITSMSFVSNQTPQDSHGHGTHVTGTSSGPADPPGESPRYGVAFSDNIFIGKVLSDQGSGTDAQILAGIDWAITNGCRVISLSLGSNMRSVSPTYEAVGQRALDAGCLVIAAAGNNASRSLGRFGFVGRPANSPSIMAVGAVDAELRIADFSARSTPVTGGQVDIVGPGVATYSSWTMPTRYRTISGTSMATPHVAGIAALLSQANGATGSALWGLLVRTAQQLEIPSVDVGAGLVQAPQ